MKKQFKENLLYSLIIIQPIFDILIYFLRINLGFESVFISLIRPALAAILYLYILFSEKVSKKEKGFSFLFLLMYLLFGIIHLLNIKGYLYYNIKKNLLNEARYIFNCGYYLMQLINFYIIFKYSDKESRKNLILSIVAAISIMCFMYFLSIITKTSGMTYEKSDKFGFKGWSISAHYIGHCCSYGLPIILYAIFEKKYIKGWYKYFIVLMPMIIAFYLCGTKTPFFTILIIMVLYTLFYTLDIILKKKKFKFDLLFLLLVSVILIFTTTSTYGYKNFYNQVKVSQSENSYDKFSTDNITYNPEVDDLEVEDDNLEFIERLDSITEQMEKDNYKAFDNRNIQILYNSKLQSISPIKDKLFGYGYFTMVNSMWVETDTLGIYYCFGWVGFALIIVIPALFIAISGIGCLIRFKELNSAKLLLGLSFGLSVVIITIVGYTLFFSQTVFYLIILWIIAAFEFSEVNYKEKRNYLFMINDLNVGGAETGLVDVLNELSKAATVDLVLLRKEGILLERLDSKIQVYEILNKKYSKIKRKIYQMLYFMGGAFTKYVYYQTIKNKYDVEVSYLEGYPAVFIASSTNNESLKIASIRVGLKNHKLSADKIPFGSQITKNAYKKIDKIYTVSKETTKEFIEKYPFCKHKTSTIYTYFNSEYINKQANEKFENYFDKKSINFLAVGRFSEQKDYLKLLEAFNKLKKDNKNVKLHILGNYNTKEGNKALKYIKDNKLENYVKLYGVIANPYPYMKYCDVLVSSSNYEGFPRVINEALCLKKLCIGTDVTGTREALDDNKGILIENSVKGLYDGMSMVMNDKNIYNKYSDQINKFDGNKEQFFKSFKNLATRKDKMIIFNAKLSYGGLESAMVEFIKNSYLNENYDLTLYLTYFGKNNYLNELPNNIKIKCACPGAWNLIGKLRAMFYFIYTYIYLFVNDYDFAICYTHHHPILARFARIASKRNVVFIHSNIVSGTTKRQQKKYKKCKYNKFKKIVCVSENIKRELANFINIKENIYYINNYIDGKKILEDAKKDVKDFEFDKNKIYFINVGRHDENVKKLMRIINATSKLNKEYSNFEVLFIGDGEGDKLYEEEIKKQNIKNIHLLGKKIPPYSYMSKSSALLTTSLREGYPVVFIESMILNLPILTVDVSDAKKDIKDKYGIVVKNDDDAIYYAMKEFLDKGFRIKERFDYLEFNNKINEQLLKLFREM